MPRFRIEWTESETYEATIEAESLEEAQDLFDKLGADSPRWLYSHFEGIDEIELEEES